MGSPSGDLWIPRPPFRKNRPRFTVRSLYLLTVWIHILVAATWIGSMVFLALVLIPSLRRQEDPALRARLMHESGLRLRVLGWLIFVVLAISGTALVGFRGFSWGDLASGRIWQGPFGHALAAKLVVFAAVLGLSFWHDYRLGPEATRAARSNPESPESRRLRRLASWCGRLTLLMALALVALAVILVRGWPG